MDTKKMSAQVVQKFMINYKSQNTFSQLIVRYFEVLKDLLSHWKCNKPLHTKDQLIYMKPMKT